MPRNGSGTYTLPAGNPVVTNTVISSTVQNTTMSDVGTALTNSIAKDGQTPITGPIDFNGNNADNVAILIVQTEIQHDGDPDNKVAFATDTQDFQTGGSSRMDISDSGLRLGAANSRVTTVLDEDNMASDSATSISTQQSIKAYTDAGPYNINSKSAVTPTLLDELLLGDQSDSFNTKKMTTQDLFNIIPASSDTVSGIIEIAVQSEMETASSTTLAVTPGRQQFHPSATKFWVVFVGSGTVSISADYNVTSITDVALGNYEINFTVPFATAAQYTVEGSAMRTDVSAGASSRVFVTLEGNAAASTTFATGSVAIFTTADDGTEKDCALVTVSGKGDQ